MVTIVWFRQDLRVADNPALVNAAAAGEIVPVYILDETQTRSLGGASRWWLHHSLSLLGKRLKNLVLMRGDPLECLETLVNESGAQTICWNRCYEPEAIARDKAVMAEFKSRGIEVKSFNGSLLHEPWELQTGAGGPFKVYSPYWRAVQKLEKTAPISPPKLKLTRVEGMGDELSDWGLLPSEPDWAAGWSKIWSPGEAGAQKRLDEFLENGLQGYGELRNRPDLENVSRLSPHLHFGEITPRQIWARTEMVSDQNPELANDAGKFLSEIAWREFAYHLLYHFPSLPKENWRPAFDAYPWREDVAQLKAWQRGQTGYPIVDAGMRELWQTGYMHNRVRMVVASFLIKHLRLHWHHGEAWFWDTLLDADLANNAASWQWVAGSGADASPYFRIFNPMTQGRKFDPDGIYVRRWCPEIAKLDNKFIHAPFEATAVELAAAGITLGETYPEPIVGHGAARAAALAGYEHVKQAKQA